MARSVYSSYYATGDLKKTWGDDTYPVEYAYDLQGRMKTMKTWKNFAGNGGAAVTSWSYDPLRGFMSAKTYADGQGLTYAYNADGSLHSRTSARNIVSTYAYDNGGTLSGVSYSDNTAGTTYALDRLGRITSVTDAAGTRTISYNADGSVASEQVPILDNAAVERAYDALGRITQTAVKRSGTTLAANNYAYDAMSRLSGVSDANASATYSRISGSSLLDVTTVADSAANPVLSVNRAYDNLDRLTAIASSTAAGTVSSRNYLYDAAGRRTRDTLADDTRWDYQYDSLGQVTSGVKRKSDGSNVPGMAFAYAYDDIGNRKTETRGAAKLKFDYLSNNLNQYTAIDVPGAVLVTGEAADTARVRIFRPRLGQKPSAIAAPTRDGKYFSAVLNVDNSDTSVYEEVKVYAFDESGVDTDLMSSVTGHEFVPQTPRPLSYDADGNLIADGRFTYSWDAENRLISILSNPVNPVKLKLEFVYDSQSRRVLKKSYSWVSGAWELASQTCYVYDGWNVLAEFLILNSQFLIDKSYAWGEDLSGSLQGAGGVGGLLAVTTADGTFLPAYDGNGNVICYANTSGSVVARYAYDPFGRTIEKSGDKADSLTYRFSTKPLDTETAMCYYGYRYYAPEFGRWINRDPMGESGGENLYCSCNNDWIENFDFCGLQLFFRVVTGVDKGSMVSEIASVNEIYTNSKNSDISEGELISKLYFDNDGSSAQCNRCNFYMRIDASGPVIKSGTTYYYMQHELNSTWMSGGIGYEPLGAVIAHEKGHAQAMWEQVIAKLKVFVENYRNIPGSHFSIPDQFAIDDHFKRLKAAQNYITLSIRLSNFGSRGFYSPHSFIRKFPKDASQIGNAKTPLNGSMYTDIWEAK